MAEILIFAVVVALFILSFFAGAQEYGRTQKKVHARRIDAHWKMYESAFSQSNYRRPDNWRDLCPYCLEMPKRDDDL